MDRTEMLIRHGYYAGLAWKLLGDDSHARRWMRRGEEITFEAYQRVAHEIQERLIAAGHIAPDEDPYETANSSSSSTV